MAVFSFSFEHHETALAPQTTGVFVFYLYISDYRTTAFMQHGHTSLQDLVEYGSSDDEGGHSSSSNERIIIVEASTHRTVNRYGLRFPELP